MTTDAYLDDTCIICDSPIQQPTTGRPRVTCSDRCRQQFRRQYNGYRWRESRHWEQTKRRAERQLRRIEKRNGPIDDSPLPGATISLRYRVLFRLQRDIPIPECLHCGHLYVTDAPGPFPEFCSPKCHQAHLAAERAVEHGLIAHAGDYDPRVDVRVRLNLPLRACNHCGRPFPPYNRHRRYCSKSCRQAHWRSLNPRCPGCGERFRRNPAKPRHTYCSEKCQNAVNARKRERTPIRAGSQVRLCVECGRKFAVNPAETIARQTCSDRCRRRAYNRAHRPCVVCRRVFELPPDRPFRRFCSVDCAHAYRARTVFKECPGCGTRFATYRSAKKRQQYCSRNCWRRADYRRRTAA